MKKEKKGNRKGDVRMRAYFDMDARLSAEIASLHIKYPGEYKKQWDTKWELIEKLNRAYEKIPLSVRNAYFRANPSSDTTLAGANAVARERLYRKQIEKGVYGRDLIQPLDDKGNPNPDFVEHYGVANYSDEQKAYIRDKMGRDPNREKDWRSAKK